MCVWESTLLVRITHIATWKGSTQGPTGTGSPSLRLRLTQAGKQPFWWKGLELPVARGPPIVRMPVARGCVPFQLEVQVHEGSLTRRVKSTSSDSADVVNY